MTWLAHTVECNPVQEPLTFHDARNHRPAGSVLARTGIRLAFAWGMDHRGDADCLAAQIAVVSRATASLQSSL